jgi:hypothetical protein
LAIKLNLAPNGYLAPPGGYPVRLWQGFDLMVEGVLAPWVTSVSAKVKSEATSTADVHAAIYYLYETPIAQLGSIRIPASGTTVTGSPTTGADAVAFSSAWAGYKLIVAGQEFTISAVASTSSMTISSGPTSAIGPAAFAVASSRTSDDALVDQVDLETLGITETELTLTLPTTGKPLPYIYRLWADNITGQEVDTVDRDADSPANTEDEAKIPLGVSVTSIVCS